jgi:hypothetical protein
MNKSTNQITSSKPQRPRRGEPKKLGLARETLRALSDADLRTAAGGVRATETQAAQLHCL